MGNFLRKAVEQRRKTLINHLHTFNHFYKEEDFSLWSLTELEEEYKKTIVDSQPL
ncbi:hypothetical protein [Bacillus sp. USDA818B3_A]|uniref:hypothetical protein n=1 Tax=Bacillus sp. USDA818B3_A TaxID=2698834 RepID=UPI0013713ECB|nr:hypothetical protein [Bacillus sp. USDA818B3_A]